MDTTNMTDTDDTKGRQASIRNLAAFIACAGAALAAASGLLEAASGFGNRFGIWDYRAGLAIFRWAAYGAFLGLVASFAGLVSSLVYRPKKYMGVIPAAAGVVAGAIGTAIPLVWLSAAMSVPPIHDISTDTVDPPGFVSVLPLRAGAPNAAEYAGQAVASLQKRAYPYITPLETDAPAQKAYEAALMTAKDGMCWVIVDASAKEGRIEATDTTFWFGFKDDIVVRIRATASGSRIDVRSVSRVGRSDVGTNAKRIKRYLDRLARNLAGR